MTDTVKAGDTISVDYTGKLEDGSVFDSSQGRDPLKFTVGAGMLIKGFDEAVLGMKPGDSKTVTIPPDKGYGERNEEAVVSIAAKNIPDDMKLEVGMQLQLSGPGGQPIPATVAEVGEEEVKMDINHFLAGKTLVFDITVRETGLEPDAHQCGCGSHGDGCDSHGGGCSC